MSTTDKMVQQLEALFDKWKGIELSAGDAVALNKTFYNFTKILSASSEVQIRSAMNDEIEQLTKWVNDLQSGMFVNCVYCGHQYGPKDRVAVTMADTLKLHVENCPKHPMNAFKKVLNEFCDDIDRTEGITSYQESETIMVPLASDEWTDLAATYLHACSVLNRPIVVDGKVLKPRNKKAKNGTETKEAKGGKVQHLDSPDLAD